MERAESISSDVDEMRISEWISIRRLSKKCSDLTMEDGIHENITVVICGWQTLPCNSKLNIGQIMLNDDKI